MVICYIITLKQLRITYSKNILLHYKCIVLRNIYHINNDLVIIQHIIYMHIDQFDIMNCVS